MSDQNQLFNQQQNHKQNLLSYRLLAKTQEKLQSIVTKITKQNFTKIQTPNKFNSETETQAQQKTQIILSLREKCTQILYQMEILQILLAENNLLDSKFQLKTDFQNFKKIEKSKQSISNIQSYMKKSFKGKQRQKTQALRDILLVLCQEAEIQSQSKQFLTDQIQNYFMQQVLQKKLSIEQQNISQQYLQTFISQIGQLREQIESLSQKNQKLTAQNKNLIQKVQYHKKLKAFQNPEQNGICKNETLFKTNGLFDCETCIKYEDQLRVLNFKIKKMQEGLQKKQLKIKQMNSQFSHQIVKYNKVFVNLTNQNQQLKKYVDVDLAHLIQQLQRQIQQLKLEQKYCYEQNQRKRPSYYEKQSQYHFYNANPNYTQRIKTQQYLPQNIFRNNDPRCRYKYENSSRSRIQVNNRAQNRCRSKHSQYSRPNSYKSSSPSSNIARMSSKRLLKPSGYNGFYDGKFQNYEDNRQRY